MRSKKSLMDVQGNEVLAIKEPIFSFPKKYQVTAAESSIMDIRSKFRLFGTKLTTTLVNKTNGILCSNNIQVRSLLCLQRAISEPKMA